MDYSEGKVMEAFKIYTVLARDGMASMEAMQLYRSDDDIRLLLDRFSNEVDCAIVRTGEAIYLIPLARISPFHVSNEWIKRNYLHGKSSNADIYLLYFATLILFGSFYDRYESREPTIDFISLGSWLEQINERIDFLRSHAEEARDEAEQEFSWNWNAIIKTWENMDDIKETVRQQSGNTVSRLSFVSRVARFLISQGMIREIGNDEITITEKAKTIVQRFYMDEEHNKGIFDFLYEYEKEADDADN